MPKAVKYILVPFGEYSDLIKLKKKTHSVVSFQEKNPLVRTGNQFWKM